jgi:putative serine/threonine protein kinase
MISNKNQISIIDFESSSTKRKPSNVTSVTQALLLSGAVSKKISQYIKIKSYDLLLNQLRNYKKVRTRLHFENILSEVNGKR